MRWINGEKTLTRGVGGQAGRDKERKTAERDLRKCGIAKDEAQLLDGASFLLEHHSHILRE